LRHILIVALGAGVGDDSIETSLCHGLPPLKQCAPKPSFSTLASREGAWIDRLIHLNDSMIFEAKAARHQSTACPAQEKGISAGIA
jgi:hypothetical protein